MDFLKKTVEQPALETKIKSDEVKIQEIALGLFFGTVLRDACQLDLRRLPDQILC